jgi:hypothetical protein
MAHARGVGWLIRQRGPHAILTEWDKAIFRNFRILIVRISSIAPFTPHELT